MNIKILDCTLRDGGYINDWEFSNKQASSIITALEKANVDTIECGYLHSTKGQAENSTLFDNLNTINTLFEDIEQLQPKRETVVDGIRLAFHKNGK